MNSGFISNLLGSSGSTDIISSISDTVPIIYTNTNGVITTYNARYYCLGNLLIQFNDSDNTTNTSSITSLNFPYPYDSGSTPYSVVSSNYSSNNISFTNSAIALSSGSTNFNFLSIGPRPSLFYPIVPFLTTGGPQTIMDILVNQITFIFNTSGTITFYQTATITSYTVIGAGGSGGAGGYAL